MSFKSGGVGWGILVGDPEYPGVLGVSEVAKTYKVGISFQGVVVLELCGIVRGHSSVTCPKA